MHTPFSVFSPCNTQLRTHAHTHMHTHTHTQTHTGVWCGVEPTPAGGHPPRLCHVWQEPYQGIKHIQQEPHQSEPRIKQNHASNRITPPRLARTISGYLAHSARTTSIRTTHQAESRIKQNHSATFGKNHIRVFSTFSKNHINQNHASNRITHHTESLRHVWQEPHQGI